MVITSLMVRKQYKDQVWYETIDLSKQAVVAPCNEPLRRLYSDLNSPATQVPERDLNEPVTVEVPVYRPLKQVV